MSIPRKRRFPLRPFKRRSKVTVNVTAGAHPVALGRAVADAIRAYHESGGKLTDG